MNVEQTCCLCDVEEETLDHLFFQCEFSGGVWKEVVEWGGISRLPHDWSEERRIMITQYRSSTRKQSMYRCMLTVIVYEIWRERNRRRMQSVSSSIEIVSQKCKMLIAWCCRRDTRLQELIAR